MAYEHILTRYEWLKLSHEERVKMREIFEIPRSSGVEMVNNKIISDGSNEHDLKAVNIASMQKFLDHADMDDTFESLYNATLEKLAVLLKPEEEKVLFDDDMHQVWPEEVAEVINNKAKEETSNAQVKKAGRPKKVKEGSNIEGTEGTGTGN